jgi:hypothetical protein
MRKFISFHWVFILVLLLLTIFLIQGIDTIPFHPDESTYLYMSGDMDIYLSNPLKLSFNLQNLDDPRQRYRLIDPPMSRYVLGLSRVLTRTPPLINDWQWSKTWEENLSNQALPSEALLHTGRIALTFFLLMSIILLYFIGLYLNGRTVGLAAAVLLGLNALALIHGRRAMAEGVLIFGITLFLFSLIHSSKHPWLAGLGMAIAFNAKHSSLLLLPVGLIAVCWLQANTGQFRTRIITNISIYLGTFILITLAMNPVFWNQPFTAIKTALDERQELLIRQVSDTLDEMPEKVLDDQGKRVVALLANLYILSPSVADVGNYLDYTAEREERYFSYFGHNLFRGFISGGLMLVLTIYGMITAGLHLSTQSSEIKRITILILLATFFQTLGLLIFIPLPTQRYVIPLVPLACIWIGFSVGILVTNIPISKPTIQLNKI